MERQLEPSQPIPIDQDNIAIRHIRRCDCCCIDLHLEAVRYNYAKQQLAKKGSIPRN